MTSRTRTVAPSSESSPAPSMTLEIPASWQSVPDAAGAAALAVYSDGRELSPGIASNAVLISQELPEHFDLAIWQREARARQLASLPDLQILDDRPCLLGGGEAWYRASVMTDKIGATLMTRQWNRMHGHQGLSLTITTLPMVDAQHADLFDAIAESWTITAQDETGTEPHA